MEDGESIIVDEQRVLSTKDDLMTGLKHILAPALFGSVLGSAWQDYSSNLDSIYLPNPVQFGLLLALFFSPLTYRLLVHTSFKRCFEYSLGFSALALPLCVVWLSGWGALFCGMYAIFLAWVTVSMMWGRRQLPPFTYGIWHAMGIDLGAFAGAVVLYNIF